MIIEYRYGDYRDTKTCSRVLRVYMDVNTVEYKGNMVGLYGLIPPVVDERGYFTAYAQPYLIAIINLAPGEYLERFDLPKD
jgi:hypothetical protein